MSSFVSVAISCQHLLDPFSIPSQKAKKLAWHEQAAAIAVLAAPILILVGVKPAILTFLVGAAVGTVCFYALTGYLKKMTIDQEPKPLSKASPLLTVEPEKKTKREVAPSVQELIQEPAVAKEGILPEPVSKGKEPLLSIPDQEGLYDRATEACKTTAKTRSMTPYNQVKDRYTNILPYTDNIWSVPKLPGLYINASPMEFGDQRYIAAQGPKLETVHDFLSAVIHDSVKVVVTVGNQVEGGKEKFEPWWEHCKNLKVIEGDESLRFGVLMREGEIIQKIYPLDADSSQERIVRRHFLIINNAHKPVGGFVQLHYQNWEDHQAPKNIALFKEFLKMVDENNKDQKRLVVHCSAGCGRTGTFIAIHSQMHDIQRLLDQKVPKDQIPVDPLGRMAEMWNFRKGMIQDQVQLGFCKVMLDALFNE